MMISSFALPLFLWLSGAPVTPGAPDASGVSGASGARASSDTAAGLHRQDPEPELAALREKLVASLDSLAAWCQKSKLYLQRDRMYEALIELDPDHAEARRALGYKRGSDGEWRRDRYREPADRGKKQAALELAALRVEKLGELRGPLLEILGRPEVSRERRLSEIRIYLALDPDDTELHAGLGEVKSPGGLWMDADVANAKVRRDELQELLKTARKSVPKPEKWTVGPPANGLGIAWKSTLSTPRAKIAGTVSAGEVKSAAEVVHYLDDLLSAAIPAPDPKVLGEIGVRRPTEMSSPRLGKYVAYLLDGPDQVPQLLKGWPKLSVDQVELFPKLATAYLDSSNAIGVWVAGEPNRLDALTRQVVGGYLRSHYGLSLRHGWAWEGLGMYLTHLAVGTHLTFFVPIASGGGVQAKLDTALMEPEADWLRALVDLMGSDDPPQLEATLEAEVAGMDIRQLVLAHGLAAYLIEAQPAKLPLILARIGGGEKAVVALKEELGRPTASLLEDVLRWADSMTPDEE